MIHDTDHELVGRLVAITWGQEGGSFLGLVREVDAPHGTLRSLKVQLHGGRTASTLSAAYSGRMLRVPIERVTGIVNRRKRSSQIEPLELPR